VSGNVVNFPGVRISRRSWDRARASRNVSVEKVRAFFYGEPHGFLEQACRAIFEAHDGKSIGAGTILVGPAAGENDVEYEIPVSEVSAVKRLLIEAGFRLTPTPDGGETS